MVRALTTVEVLKLWCKSTVLSLLFALAINIITTQIGNGIENLPSSEDCKKLYQQNSVSKFENKCLLINFYLFINFIYHTCEIPSNIG